MPYSEVCIFYVFQNIVYWQEEHICDDFDRCVHQSVLSVVDFDRHLGDENPNENIDETYLCGQQWPNHGIRRESEYEFHLSTYVCSGDVKKQRFSPHCRVLSCLFPKNCHLRKPFSAACDVNWIARGHSIFVGRSVSIRGTAPTMHGNLFFQLPPDFNLEGTSMVPRRITLRKFSNKLFCIHYKC